MESISKKSSNSFQCVDALEVSLSIEKQGFIYYDKAAKSATNPRVRAIFLRLANEEKEHIQSLQSKTRFLQPALANRAKSQASRTESFIKNEIHGKVFPTSGDFEDGLGVVENDFEALSIGINAEIKSIELLSQLIASEKKMDVRVIFNHLLAEEKKHLLALEELRKDLGHERA
jgi:rubrerythrin